MLMSYLKCGWKKKSLKLSLWAVLTLLTYAQPGMVASAQDSWPFENPFSPLASFPLLRGEAKVIPTLVTLRKSSINVNNSVEGTNNYVGSFAGGSTFFLDLMARLQLSRFSIRGHLEQREFAGVAYFGTGTPTLRHANLTYYGIRVGGDVDIFLGNRTRVGFNYDQSFYGPTFTVFNPNSIPSPNTNNSPFSAQGPQSGTIGCHLIYNPVWDVFGTSAIFEGWAHWPIYGTALSDFEVSGGLKWADTVLGSGSIQGGYRWTNISTSDLSPGTGNLNATWGGVFGEVVYYYR